MGVVIDSLNPGETMLTRILLTAHSDAKHFPRFDTAALEELSMQLSSVSNE